MTAGFHQGYLKYIKRTISIAFLKKGAFKTVFAFLVNIGRRNADGAMAQVIVNVNQILYNINLQNGTSV